MKQLGLYLNGQYVQSSSHFPMHHAGSSETQAMELAQLNSENGDDAQIFEAALDGIKISFEQMQSGFFPLAERLQFLLRLREKLFDKTEMLARLITLEIGKPITLSRAEIGRAIETLIYTIECAENVLAKKKFKGSLDKQISLNEAVCFLQARGPLFAITPFNFPINLMVHKIAPAIASGCTVLLKPSPKAQMCTLSFVDLLQSCELPAGVLNMIQVSNQSVGKIISDLRINHFSFTGSASVGWNLAAAHPSKKATLELGGNAPVFVDCSYKNETEALQKIADQICKSAFNYGGQTCISAQNVYADPEIFEDLKLALTLACKSFPYGNPFSPLTLCGPLIDAEHFQKTLSLKQSLIDVGAELIGESTNIIAGEENFFLPPESFSDFSLKDFQKVQQPTPHLMAPTLWGNIPESHSIFEEEIFAPILTLSKVHSFNDFVTKVNSQSHRLQVSVYSRDKAVQQSAATRLDFGGVLINQSPSLRIDALPYGGQGLAGLGREGPEFAMREFCEWKTIIHCDL